MTDAWHVEPLTDAVGFYALASARAAEGEIAWLDSAVASSQPQDLAARYSLLCAGPAAILEQFEGKPAHVLVAGKVIAEDASGWALWRRMAAELPKLSPLPFTVAPGWVGYVGFEMARQLERLPASRHEDLGLPLLRMALFDRGVVFDHHDQRAHAVSAPGVREALGDLGSGSRNRANARIAPDARDAGTTPTIKPAMSRSDYERMVRRAIEYIAAGDIYQVNLAQRFEIEGLDDPLGLYAAVRRSNPAAYGALLKWADGAVASFSPELFLQLRENRVLTRPIKGTRPRTGDPALDDAYRRELLTSAKEAAELAMIVDLHRNDLGRVCRYGSVRVVHPRRIEAHPSVFHTVADIVGELAPGRSALDLLAACFPAGSISGVPKIRALEIIDELEPAARGVYTGAIGVLGLDGQMTFNVAIRTLQMRGRRATLYVGGGIVADSDPAAEYEETLAKAAGILRGVKAASGEWRVASSELPTRRS